MCGELKEMFMNELLRRIKINPEIMGGKPVIKGTRIPVESILRRLSEGLNIKEILEDYPYLTEEDIRAALLYASKVLEDTSQESFYLERKQQNRS